MNEEPAYKAENVRDTEQLIKDIETVISRIKLLRIRIALYLLLTEVSPPLGGETSDSWNIIRGFQKKISSYVLWGGPEESPPYSSGCSCRLRHKIGKFI